MHIVYIICCNSEYFTNIQQRSRNRRKGDILCVITHLRKAHIGRFLLYYTLAVTLQAGYKVQ